MLAGLDQSKLNISSGKLKKKYFLPFESVFAFDSPKSTLANSVNIVYKPHVYTHEKECPFLVHVSRLIEMWFSIKCDNNRVAFQQDGCITIKILLKGNMPPR